MKFIVILIDFTQNIGKFCFNISNKFIAQENQRLLKILKKI